MYILDPVYYLCKPEKRADLLSISKQIAESQGVSQVQVIFDMIGSAVKYGTMWTEYGDLGFYFRSPENRKSFITTFYNFKLYDKINKQSERKIFHDKICFLKKFSEYIKRDWVSTEDHSDDEVLFFLQTHKNIVAKASGGDSGKEVEVINSKTDSDLYDLLNYIKEKQYNLIEEQIYNHPAMNPLHPGSLNTVRIVTLRTDQSVEFLFAGIRVGAKDSKIDNISQGGKVASLDLLTGKIASPFYSKASSHSTFVPDKEDRELMGFQLPCWNQVTETVKKAAMVVPEIRIVAWDIAITENGVDLVEGNESFGSVIMQLACSHTEYGLKPKLENILNNGGINGHCRHKIKS